MIFVKIKGIQNMFLYYFNHDLYNFHIKHSNLLIALDYSRYDYGYFTIFKRNFRRF